MIRIVPLRGLFLAALWAAAIQPLSAADRPQAEIQAQYAVLDRAAAAHDASLAKKVFAEDFTGVDINGRKQNRDAFLKDGFAPSPGIKALVMHTTIDAIAVRGERADVTARAEGTFDFTMQGSSTSRPARALVREEDTWALRGGTWVMVASHDLEMTQWLDGRQVQHQVAVVPVPAVQSVAIVAQLKKTIVPLRTVLPGGSLADLLPLQKSIGKARIVGMGEGTHGTSEFFSMKDRLFRFLVQKMGFTVFAMETNWTDGRKIEEYVTSGRGDLRAALSSTFAVWDNQEVLDMLEWMRAYNAAPGKHATLHFVGIDMQSPMDATDIVSNFYARNMPGRAAEVTGSYACLHYSYPQVYVVSTKRTQAQKNDCKAKAAAQYERTQSDTRHAPAQERQLVQHAALIALQAATMFANDVEMDARDAAMAKNTEWVAREVYPHARIALWAHNGHIAAAPLSYVTMGSYLRRSFANDYYAIGFSFDRGDISLNGYVLGSAGPGPDGSSEAMFRQVRRPLFLLDLHAAPAGTPLRQWLAHDRPVSMLGALSDPAQVEASRDYPMPLPKTFDSLIFVEQSHAAHSFSLGRHRDSPVTSMKAESFPAGSGGRAIAAGWMKSGSHLEAYDDGADGTVRHGNGPSIWLSSLRADANAYGTLTHALDIAPFRGKRVRISGYLKTQDVKSMAGFWLRIEQAASKQPLAFDNMSDRPLAGSVDWRPFAIVLDVPQNASGAFFGLLLSGAGKVWADDVSIDTVDAGVATTDLIAH